MKTDTTLVEEGQDPYVKNDLESIGMKNNKVRDGRKLYIGDMQNELLFL